MLPLPLPLLHPLPLLLQVHFHGFPECPMDLLLYCPRDDLRDDAVD